MDRHLDLFVHIPKTAGLTMLGILRDEYPAGSILSLRGVDDAERPARLAAVSEGIRVVAGHVHSKFAAHLPRRARLFTILREPIDRVLSLYYFLAREKSMGSHAAVVRGGLTLEDLAWRHGSMQARYVAGYEPTAVVPGDVLLREAKDALTQQMVAFGLTERFDESLLFFNTALGWNVRGYHRENVTRQRPTTTAIAPADLAAMRAHCAIDIEFYDFASGLFEQRIAEQPADFADRLDALRSRIEARQLLRMARAGWKMIRRTLRIAN